MGSSVIIAVKHDRQRAYNREFTSEFSSAMHCSNYKPTFFSGESPYEDPYRRKGSLALASKGILVSHYIDNEHPCSLLINHDMMVNLSVFLDTREAVIKSEKDLIKQILKRIKNRSYPFGSFMRKGRLELSINEPAPPQEAGCPMSLFMIQTDNYDSDQFHDHFRNMLLFVDTGCLLRPTFGRMELNNDSTRLLSYGDNIQFLGQIDSQSAAFISMRYGNPDVLRIPNRKIEWLSQEAAQKLTDEDLLILRSFMKSLGIDFKKIELKMSMESGPGC